MLLTPPRAEFHSKSWINQALVDDRGAGDQTEDMRLSVLLTKLQLQATDVDTAIHDAVLLVAAVTPQVVRDIVSVKVQVSAVRGDMANLMEEVENAEASSEASVELLREGLHTQQRMAAVADMLRQSERVAQLMLSAEAALKRGDPAAAAEGVAELGGCLGALGERRLLLFPEADARLQGLQIQLQRELEPALVRLANRIWSYHGPYLVWSRPGGICGSICEYAPYFVILT